jgi:hypothetical protein
LLGHYEDGLSSFRPRGGPKRNVFIHVDDRDDGDSLTDFCNIFCSAISGKRLRLELTGRFPITEEMANFAEAHGGFADVERGTLSINISIDQTLAVDELAQLVKKTARMGSVIGNPVWFRISARTVSSLLRFGRVLREYSEGAGDRPNIPPKN